MSPSMNTVFIIHGAYGHPSENWFPWAKKMLEKEGYEVIIPAFPTPEDQTPENWMKVFEKYESKLGVDSIIIGHSLGVAFILRVLEKLDSPIRAAILAAGFVTPAPEKFKTESFVEKPFEWEKIRKNCSRFFVLHGDDDPYNAPEKAEVIAKELRTKAVIIPNGGHLNEKAGFLEFPAIMEIIHSLSLKNQHG